MSLSETTADDPRIVGLRRMRTLATLLLVFMAVLLVATSYGQAHWPWLAYVRAFAEAGVVGACADWFAVVALFRHPFGVPIPHTAIVPRNKARIAGAMGRFISNNFLTPKVLSARLGRIDAAGWAVDWLSQPENIRRVARVVALAIPEIVRALPREQIGQMVQEQVHRGLTAVPAAPVASHLLAIAWAQGQTQKLIERSLELIETSLTSNKDVIRHKLEAGSSRWVPRWFDGMVAEKVFTALMATLTDMRDPELSQRIEALKADVIADPLFNDQLRAIWIEIENRLPADASVYSDRIASITESALAGAVRWLADNPPVQQRINRWMRFLIRRTIAPRRAEIGAFVTQVVENWDTTTLVNRIELQVGKDLQYIRINGTLVGGLVGLIIYTASVWLLPG